MSHRILDPNDPEDLREIKQLILEEEPEQECKSFSLEEFPLRSHELALRLQFYSMIWFNYSDD